MRYTDVCIESCDYVLPEKIITSENIESKLEKLYRMLSCPKGQLEALTGVKERRVWKTGTLPSSIAAEAAQKTIEKSGTKPEEIDLIIYTGVCRDKLEPSTANVVHHKLGLSADCLALDVSNACTGFLNGMMVAANMIESKSIRSALIVTGENAGPLYDNVLPKLENLKEALDFRKHLASLTLGSAGVAMILTQKELSKTGHKLLGALGQTDSSGYHLCQGTGDINSLEMETDTAGLMRQGLALVVKTWEFFKRHLEWTNETPDHVLTHQISKKHQEKAFALMNIPQEKSSSHLDTLGNTGSAAAPLSLAQGMEKDLFKKGEKILLSGIGSGINTLVMGLEW